MDAAEALALLMSPPGRIDPYPTYERLRRHGPVVQAGPVFDVVTGYAEGGGILRAARFGRKA
ncbi:cytochrome P450, partial [Micromonospora sp. CPCC 205714]